MTALDRLIPTPRLLEIDHVDVAAQPAEVWKRLRHGELPSSMWVRALFAIRSLPARFRGEPAAPGVIRIDDFVSSDDNPGFQLMVDDPPHEVAIAAIGKVWEPDIPFVHSLDVEAYESFAVPDFAKVAWAVRVLPRGDQGSRVEIEVRVDTTDEEAWSKFRRYFRLIGIGSRFIRHSTLAALAKELGASDAKEEERLLDGDDLLPDATLQQTHFVDVNASPEAVWPWLIQMGCRRAGFYSIDVLDNDDSRSARELHPEYPPLSVGDVIPATPDGEDGFEVLRMVPHRCLVLGGLHDPETQKQLPFVSARPPRFWQATWAFILEPLDERTTRLHARARAALGTSQGLHALWIGPVHALMERTQLRNLAARVEHRLPRDDWRDVLDGVGGAAVMMAAMFTSFLRDARNHWGLSEELAARGYPGDELVPEPSWMWTHSIEIAASAETVWPWVAQIGADRGGFYSYQWLENLAGCELSNAERIHPEWQLQEGDKLVLSPNAPPLHVVHLVPGRFLVAHDASVREEGKPWAQVTWLFFVEPLGPGRCRLISRYRCATSDDLKTRLALGPTLIEPIGFAMDRRMLKGIKERAEHAPSPLRHFEAAPSTT